jgi:hypothetical protein
VYRGQPIPEVDKHGKFVYSNDTIH